MLSIFQLCSLIRKICSPAFDLPTWKFRVIQLSKAGDRAWKLVVPCADLITSGVDITTETANEIIISLQRWMTL